MKTKNPMVNRTMIPPTVPPATGPILDFFVGTSLLLLLLLGAVVATGFDNVPDAVGVEVEVLAVVVVVKAFAGRGPEMMNSVIHRSEGIW